MSDDKTEEPTEHKLEQARQEGQVPKSQDATVAASMLAAVGALMLTGEGSLDRLRAVLRSRCSSMSTEPASTVLLDRCDQGTLDPGNIDDGDVGIPMMCLSIKLIDLRTE